MFSVRSLRAGLQVFAYLILFLCVMLHTMWSDKSLHLTPSYIVFICQQDNVCENSIGSMYVGRYGGLSKSGLLCIP